MLKNISRFKSLKGEEATRVPPSDSAECRREFEKEKEGVRKRMEEDPLGVVEQLLGEKLKV